MPSNVDTVLDKDELRELVADELELPLEEVTDQAEFAEDLGVDSLVAMELIVVLEKRYGVKVDESELTKITSLNNVYEVITSKFQGG